MIKWNASENSYRLSASKVTKATKATKDSTYKAKAMDNAAKWQND